MTRRSGGVPGIVTVIITIASIAAAALVAYFMYTTTRSATSQPIIEVTSAYASGSNLALTIRNLGSVDVTITDASIVIRDISCVAQNANKQLAKGSSIVVSASCSSLALSDGDSGYVTLSGTTQNNLAFSITIGFRVVVP
ncbi:MAG: hypothetical protein QW291_06890 [Thermofilaceae archaeon]